MSKWHQTPLKKTNSNRNVPVPITPDAPILCFTSANEFSLLGETNEAQPTKTNKLPTTRTNEEVDFWEYRNMTASTEPTKLINYMNTGATAMQENLSPTTVDVIAFKKRIATALTKCHTHTHTKGGHVFLILDEDEYRTRIKDQTASLPVRPTQPTKPVGTATKLVSSTAYKMWEDDLREYTTCENYDQQIKDLIELKFPNGLAGLRDEEDDLPISLTASQAIAHVMEKVSDEVLTNKCFKDILEALLTRKYTTNANGPEDWFKDAERDRLMTTKLGHRPIPYFIIMICAQTTFRESGHQKELLRNIDEEWKSFKATRHLEEDTVEIYMAFKKFYITRLKTLYVDSDQHKAYSTKEIENRFANMEYDVGQLNANQEDL